MKKVLLLSLICLPLFLVSTGYSESTEDLMNTGTALLNGGASDQAVTCFKKIVAREPRNFEAQFNLGLAYLNWGRFSNAVTEFNAAIRLNSQSAEAWSNLAMAHQNMGQKGKAMDALNRAVQANPSNIQARLNLAVMLVDNNKLAEAIAQYKQVRSIDGNNIEANLNLGKCLVTKGSYDEAKKYLRDVLAINPNEGDAYWELGNISWNKEKNYPDAITSYKKAIEVKPNSSYYENLAKVYEELWKKNRDDSKRTDAVATWKQYLVYCGDVLKKEEVLERIDLLEKGQAPNGAASTEELFGSKANSKGDVEKLRNEMRNQGTEKETDNRKLDVKGPTVDNDLSDLDKNKASDFDFDMKKAVKEKKDKDKEKDKEKK
jgi:tetratricopeptide (TPR) repeat protein